MYIQPRRYNGRVLARIAPSEKLFLDHAGWWTVGVISIFVLMQIEILLHELGHWIMAKLCGYMPIGFCIGEGTLVWQKETPRSLWQLHFWPLSGHVIALKMEGVETRLQRLLLFAGGPLFTATCGGLSYWGYRHFHANVQVAEPIQIVTAQVLAVTAVLSFVSLIYNLWPHGGSSGNQCNDGSQMLEALVAKDFPRPPAYQRMLHFDATEPAADDSISKDGRAQYLKFYRCLLAKRSGDIVAEIQTAMQLPDLSATEQSLWRLLLLDAALDFPKELNLLEYAAEVESKFPAETNPATGVFQAMQGALLIELGEDFEGRASLHRIERNSGLPEAKAFALAYLAISDFRQGSRDEAHARLRHAHQLCPRSKAVSRADEEIHQGFYSRL